MAFDGFTMRCIILELQARLANGRIERIYQPQSDTLLLNIHTGYGREKLLLSANPADPRIHLSDKVEPSQQHPPMFCMLLRKHLGGGIITSVEQYGMDRIFEMAVKNTDQLGEHGVMYLACEIMGRHSNIILLDNDRRIIDSVKRVSAHMSSFRQVFPGIEYKSPPSQDKLDLTNANHIEAAAAFSRYLGTNAAKAVSLTLDGMGKTLSREFCARSCVDPDKPLDKESADRLCSSVSVFRDILRNKEFYPVIYYNNSEIVDFYPVMLTHINLPFEKQQSVNSMLDNYYHEKLKHKTMTREKDSMLKVLNSLLEKNRKKLSTRLHELHDAQDKSHYRLYGQLLTANLYRLKEKRGSVELEDYTRPDLPLVKIKLDPDLTPQENARTFFKKYSHGKRAKENLEKLINQSNREIDYLESLIYSIEKCTQIEELHEIKLELESQKYIKPSKSKVKTKVKKQTTSKPLVYLSRDNFKIFVGRNNYQNDYLTLKFAGKNDLWLHTKDIPGSHVLIRSEGKDLPDTTLYQAALLAAYFSKARQSSSVPVDYTLAKYVSKPSGAKPGYVIYKNQKTVFITPDKEEILKIQEINHKDTAD